MKKVFTALCACLIFLTIYGHKKGSPRSFDVGPMSSLIITNESDREYTIESFLRTSQGQSGSTSFILRAGQAAQRVPKSANHIKIVGEDETTLPLADINAITITQDGQLNFLYDQ